nr:hypothetical protein [Treponema sp.]
IYASLSIVEAQNKSSTVYITEKGKKYHLRTCRTIQKSEVTAVLKAEAEKMGLSPCKICKP